MSVSREASKRFWRIVPLADEIAGVGREGPEAVDPAGGPANLDRLDPVGVAEAEMEAGVAGRPGSCRRRAARRRGAGRRRSRLTLAPTASRFEAVPSRRRVKWWPPSVRLWAYIRGASRQAMRRSRRPSLSRSPTARARPSRSVRTGAPARSPTSVRRPSVPPEEQLRGHRVGRLGPEVVDVAVGLDQVEPAVVVGVEEGDPEAEAGAGGGEQAEGAGPVVEDALAEVLVEGRPLVVEVGDDQVGAAVAVDVAAADPHPRLVAA